MEILRASETELPIFKTELPILGRQFQNERTVRSKSKIIVFATGATSGLTRMFPDVMT